MSRVAYAVAREWRREGEGIGNEEKKEDEGKKEEDKGMRREGRGKKENEAVLMRQGGEEIFGGDFMWEGERLKRDIFC